MSICKYCKKSFKSDYNLTRHQNTANYCISQRKILLKPVFNCKYCNKEFTQSATFLTHESVCNLDENELKLRKMNQKIKRLKIKLAETENKLDTVINENTELKLQLANKEGRIEELKVAKPASITNNISIKNKLTNIRIKGIQPLTEELITDNLGNYTFDLYLKGSNGIIQFLKPLMVSYDDEKEPMRNYVCTNPTKHNFHKLNIVKEWKRDHGAYFLNTVIDLIKPKVCKYAELLADKALREGEYYQNINNELECFYKGVNIQGKYRNIVITEIRTGVKEYTTI